ncbi:MAG: DUF5752 family protein, partial [Nitrospirales bacterium]
VEESQQFLHPGLDEMAGLLAPLLSEGGVTVVSYRPDRLAPAILDSLHQVVLTRVSEPEAVRVLMEHGSFPVLKQANLAELAPGHALLASGQLVRLRPTIRHIPHIRHLFKYLDKPLPAWKRFWFRTPQGDLGVQAASLYEFLQLIPTLPIESLEYHDRRQDFARWIGDALGYGDLAARLRKLSNRQVHGEELREALQQLVAMHYTELKALR